MGGDPPIKTNKKVFSIAMSKFDIRRGQWNAKLLKNLNSPHRSRYIRKSLGIYWSLAKDTRLVHLKFTSPVFEKVNETPLLKNIDCLLPESIQPKLSWYWLKLKSTSDRCVQNFQVRGLEGSVKYLTSYLKNVNNSLPTRRR